MVLRLARRFQSVHVPHILFHQRQHPGVRGPSRMSLTPREVFDTWKGFDQIVLRAIHASHELTEFLNELPRGAVGPRELDDRLDPRSSIMARVGVWDLATADLAAAAQQAKPAAAVSLNSQELNALRRVFERWARSTFDNIEQGQAFFAAVGEFESRALRNSIKAALIWPVSTE